MKKSILILFLVLSLAIAGCQTKTTTKTTTTPTTKSQTKTTTTTTTNKTTPPTQLGTIESNAEDIITDIVKNDWTASQSRVNDIKTNFNTLNPILVSVKVSNDTINGMNNAITSLEAAVNSKKSYDARAQANQISKYVPDVFDYYKVTVPTDVSRLDYLGREINLNVEKADWASASTNYQTASKLWSSLKSSLKTDYKKDIDTFQSNMDSLKSAIDKKNATETTKQANTLLENIDTLETDFTNQNKT